jgi:TetR/AcrR family transcriptional regulator, fatty acid metabolism regulator protein
MGKVEDSIEKIIQATIRVAFERGFANTRTADIAKEAGVSEGLIFKYFPTKSHLFAIIIKGVFQRLKAGADAIITQENMTASVKLDALIDYHFNFFSKQYNIIFLILGHSERKSVELEPVIEHALKPYTQLMAKVINAGMESGEFRSCNAETIAMAIIGSMQFNLISKLLLGNTGDLEATKNEVKEYILSGIKAAK